MKKNILFLLLILVSIVSITIYYTTNQLPDKINDQESQKFDSLNSKLTILDKNKVHLLSDSIISNDPFEISVSEPPNTIHYILDCDSSKVTWFCDKHTGYIKFKQGHFSVIDNEIIGGVFIVSMDSITNTDIDYYLMKGTLEKILKSSDFFNVIEYPNSMFKIKHVKKIENNEYFVSGYMKIFDAYRLIKFYSTIEIMNDTLIATSQKFTIDRTNWGLTTSSKDYVESDESFIIPDKIDLIIHLLGVAK